MEAHLQNGSPLLACDQNGDRRSAVHGQFLVLAKLLWSYARILVNLAVIHHRASLRMSVQIGRDLVPSDHELMQLFLD